MEAIIDRTTVDDLTSHFKAVTSIVPLNAIRTEAQYDRAVEVLNQLLDAGAADENHPLADLVDTLGSLIGDYDDEHYQAEAVSGTAMLRFLMDQNRLNQSDLPEIGTQGVVSEILNGKRELNLRQIRVLAERFNVPANVFL
jgi:HTH-type transcriptional regulator/antitoxin HigA